MNRRQFFAGVAAAAPFLNAASSRSQPGPAAAESDVVVLGPIPPLPADLLSQSDQPPAPPIDTTVVGTGRPKQDEVDAAYEILLGSPYQTSPIDVAQYFLSVGAGAYGEGYRQYVREWPVRANPLIYHVFSATQTKPEGDTTAWCAAFVNWCILRSHASSANEIGAAPGAFSKSGDRFSTENFRRFSTNSASSGSFRCWEETKTPKRGDVVVFKDPGTDGATERCLGTGHVAFYLRVPSNGLVQVLGGNQTLRGSNGAVTVANMKTTPGSRFMKYVALKGA